jgi:ribonuclease T1
MRDALPQLPASDHAAVHFLRVTVADNINPQRVADACGAVAGIYARTSSTHGVNQSFTWILLDQPLEVGSSMQREFACFWILLRKALLLSVSILQFAACGTGSRMEPSSRSTAPKQEVPAPRSNKSIRSDEIDAAELPPEARHMLLLIQRGGLFPYAKDGTVFGNREGILPSRQRGYYHEYTVRTPGASDRGARRIIEGKNGEYYYTDDHYRTFKRIRE